MNSIRLASLFRHADVWGLSLAALLSIALSVKADESLPPSARPAPSFDPQGHMTINGQPAFPIGAFIDFNPSWVDNHPDELLAKVKDLGDSPFNFTISYGSLAGTPDQRKRYYDQLQQHGLIEFVGIEKFYKNLGNASKQLQFDGTEQEAITREVQLAKDWRGVGGWYIYDEEPYDAKLVRQHHEWAKQVDPSRPTLSLTSRHEMTQIQEYASTGDIYALDRYPIPVRGSMTLIADDMDRMCKSASKGQPIFFVLQAFGDYVYYDEVRSGERMIRPEKLRGPLRAPTPEEIQGMTFLSLAHGATGLVVYYYKDIKLTADADVRWKAVKATAKCVQEIAPILLSPALPPGELQCDNPAVHFRAFAKDGKTYVVAVNATRELQTAWLDGFEHPIQSVKVIQGQSLAAGAKESGKPRVVLQLDALETLVAEIQTNP